MTLHTKIETRSAVPVETREDDPLAAATAAVEELRSASEQFRTQQASELAGITERLAGLETRLNRPGTQQENRDEPSAEQRAFAAYLSSGAVSAEEQRALTQSNDVEGGYLSPPEFASEVIRELIEYSPIRRVASVRQTTSPSVIYPTRGDITNSQWIGEGQELSESTITFGQREISVREHGTFVDISNRLLADAPQAETEVRSALGEDFGKSEAKAFLYGDGPLQPEGLMINEDIEYTPNGHAANLSADALITLLYALPATYRNAGSWALNGITLGIVRKLKDGQGNFLWQPSYQAGQPETILGRPVVEMVDLPDVAADAFPIIYGDFTGYRIIDRLGLSVLVDPYTQRIRGVSRVYANRRVGGGVLQPAKFRKLKMANS